MSRALFVSLVATRDPIFWGMLANRPALVNGEFPLPTTPGFGWVLDEDFIDQYRTDTK